MSATGKRENGGTVRLTGKSTHSACHIGDGVSTAPIGSRHLLSEGRCGAKRELLRCGVIAGESIDIVLRVEVVSCVCYTPESILEEA